MLSGKPASDWNWAEWFLAGASLLVILSHPPLGIWRYRRLAKAERLNTEVLHGYQARLR